MIYTQSINYTVDTYTPCRMTELYLDTNEEIEIATVHGIFRLKGFARKVWLMLDGKHDIHSIVSQLCLEYYDKNVQDNGIKERVIATLKSLKEKEAIIVNWDPLYKFKKCSLIQFW